MIDRLKALREEGKMIITPHYCISYNPFRDVFLVDVPDEAKHIWLTFPSAHDYYLYDAERMFPIEVEAEQDYEKAWEEIELYTQGATIDNLPSFTKDGKEYVWFDGEEYGVEAVVKETITILNKE